MRAPPLVIVACAALGLAAAERAAASPACVTARAEARYAAYAYNHIVHLANLCATAQACEVATDVNPQPVSVTVPARSAIEVLTFRGSPSRVFTPQVSCADARRPAVSDPSSR